jgi:hypothetical protein
MQGRGSTPEALVDWTGVLREAITQAGQTEARTQTESFPNGRGSFMGNFRSPHQTTSLPRGNPEQAGYPISTYFLDTTPSLE